MDRVTILSDRTGARSQIFIDLANDGLVTGQGDRFSPAYIHSQLFGGMGPVRVESDDASLRARVEAILTASPQIPDRRTFGHCGSR